MNILIAIARDADWDTDPVQRAAVYDAGCRVWAGELCADGVRALLAVSGRTSVVFGVDAPDGRWPYTEQDLCSDGAGSWSDDGTHVDDVTKTYRPW